MARSIPNEMAVGETKTWIHQKIDPYFTTLMRGLRMAVEVDQTHILPVEAVFHSNWWFRNYGMKFSKAYFFDPETRVQSDRLIRQILFDRFPDLDLGEQNAQPRPVVGSVLIAAGYIISAIHGCHVL